MRQEKRSGVGSSLSPLLCAWLVVAGCRPDVEANIPCGTQGDASCPTGWQCGLVNRCVPGERVAVVTPVIPSVGAGLAEVSWAFEMARDFESATVVLRASDGTALAPKTQVTSGAGLPRAGAVVATFETWKVPDGDAMLEFSMAAGGVNSEWRFPWRVAQVPTSVTLVSPAADALLRGDVEVVVDIAGSVPWVSLDVSVGSLTRAADASRVGTARLSIVLLASSLADGVTPVKARVVDALGRADEDERSVVMSNVRAKVLEVVAPPFFSPKRRAEGARIRVRTEGMLEGPPTLVAGAQGFLFGAPVAGEAAGEWLFDYASGRASGLTSMTATVRDRFGLEATATGTTTTDFEPPVVARNSEVMERRKLGSKVGLDLACGEPGVALRFDTDTTTGVTGTCGPELQSFEAAGTRLVGATLTDAEGNVGTLAGWATAVEGTPRVATSAQVEGFEVVGRRSAFAANAANAAIAAQGGASMAFDPAQFPPNGSEWLAVPRTLRGFEGGAVVSSTASGAVLVLATINDAAALFELGPGDVGVPLLPWFRLPGAGRPTIVGGHELAWVTKTSVVRRALRSMGATAAPVSNPVGATVSCGSLLFGVIQEAGRVTAYWAGSDGAVRSQILAGATATLPPDVGAGATCADGWPVVLLMSDAVLDVYALPDPSGMWSQAPFANATVRPPPRAGVCFGADGLLGGGLDSNGAPVRDLWRLGKGTFESLVAANQGPSRLNATLFQTNTGVIAVGGRSPTGVTKFAVRQSNGFAESAQPTDPGARSLMDYARTSAGTEFQVVERVAGGTSLQTRRPDQTTATVALPGVEWVSLATHPRSDQLFLLAGAQNAAKLYNCGSMGAACTLLRDGITTGPATLLVRNELPLVGIPRQSGLPFALWDDGSPANVTFTTSLPGQAEVLHVDGETFARVAVSTLVGGAQGVRLYDCALPDGVGAFFGCTPGAVRAAEWPAIALAPSVSGVERAILNRGGLVDVASTSSVPFAVPMQDLQQPARRMLGTSEVVQELLDPPVFPISNRSLPVVLLEIPAAQRATGRVRARVVNGNGFNGPVLRVESLGSTGEARAVVEGDGWIVWNWTEPGRTEAVRLSLGVQPTAENPAPRLEIDHASYEIVLAPPTP